MKIKNHERLLCTVGIVLVGMVSVRMLEAEPPNLGILKRTVKEYSASGQYHQEVAAIAQEAEHYLMKLVEQEKQNKPSAYSPARQKKWAVVFDIDETCLSNYAYMLKYDFSGIKPVLEDQFEENSKPLEAVLRLYRRAQQLGFELFFITGRGESFREATEDNLRAAGYTGWRHLAMKPRSWSGSSRDFKTSERHKIVRQGYTIKASVGDQYSDLLGGHAGYEFKLPNPFYFVA